jgi:hypothetical protein
MRRRIHACHVSYEEEDICMSCVIRGGGYMHVMCHMRRRIYACHVSYEEEDTCMSCVI